MSYYAFTDREVPAAGVLEGEIVIYTSNMPIRQKVICADHRNNPECYVYIWKDGKSEELIPTIRYSRHGPAILSVSDIDTYTFLWDRPYIRQLSGPAKPITVANLGSAPVRVDTLLGEFSVEPGAMLRLGRDTPRKEKVRVQLDFSTHGGGSLQSAWTMGNDPRQLRIQEEPAEGDEDRLITVRDDDGSIVQCVAVNKDGEFLMLDPPEPEPKYEIYIAGPRCHKIALRFLRTDYANNRVVQRVRSLSFMPGLVDLQKLRESRAQAEVKNCTVNLSQESDTDSEFELSPWEEAMRNQLLESGEEERPHSQKETNDRRQEPPAEEIIGGSYTIFDAEPPEIFPQ